LVIHSESTEGLESGEKALQTIVDDVKKEWKLLWRNRIDDKVRAEGIANQEYSLLFVERATVIIATRDFKPLDLKDILHLHKIQHCEQIIPPHPSVGGWGKFARDVLKKQRRARKWMDPAPRRSHKKNLQLKKGGRGWLHYRMKK
jgi:hypothetical protein